MLPQSRGSYNWLLTHCSILHMDICFSFNHGGRILSPWFNIARINYFGFGCFSLFFNFLFWTGDLKTNCSSSFSNTIIQHFKQKSFKNMTINCEPCKFYWPTHIRAVSPSRQRCGDLTLSYYYSTVLCLHTGKVLYDYSVGLQLVIN